MTDEELRRLAEEVESLSPDAIQVLEREIARRGLDISLVVPAIGIDRIEGLELITIRRFRDLPEAVLAKGMLHSAGIECFLEDDNIVRMDWFYSNAVGGIKLQVSPEDVASAIEILQQPIPENFEVDGLGEYQQPRCPECNSLDIVFEELNEGVAYGSAYLGLPLPVHEKGWKCKTCGHRWEDAKAPAGEEG